MTFTDCSKAMQAVAAMLFLCSAASGVRAEDGRASDYRLGPQDKLQVSVYDWRTGSGEAYQWAALNGEFTVGAGGGVSLPLVGEIPASTGTSADLATAIAERLQAKIGLAQRPDASVQVIRYRPFFIMGDVEKPGQFDYQPGLTVLQALGAAGGLRRMTGDNLLGYERDALVSRGDLRVMAADRLGLIVRQARLDAEIKALDAIDLPTAIVSRLSEPDVARAVREERLLFETRRTALQLQVDVIGQTKAILDQEVTSLAAKATSLDRQLELTRRELAQVSDLVSKGLAVTSRQLAAEQSAASYESGRLDVQLATLRAQQDRSKLDRDTIDLQSRRRSDALTEATEVRAKLAGLAEKIETVQTLIRQSEVRAPLALAESESPRAPIFRLTRRADGRAETKVVDEGDRVEPGDVLRVDLPPRKPSTAGRDLAADRASLDDPVSTASPAAARN